MSLQSTLLQENATLADRLIHDQVQYAQQTEEVYAMRRDLAHLNNSVKANGTATNLKRVQHYRGHSSWV